MTKIELNTISVTIGILSAFERSSSGSPCAEVDMVLLKLFGEMTWCGGKVRFKEISPHQVVLLGTANSR